METKEPNVTFDRLSVEEMTSTIGTIKKMLVVGALFAAVGYLLLLAALFLELTQFHPLLETFFREFTAHSLAGGGPERTSGALNRQLATIHQFPSTLLWLKLGGIGHILVGIFVVLAAIVRALSMMPHRLSYELEQTQG
jgi:small-conductance mechanosensitive channel